MAADLARELQKIDGLICDIRSANARLKQYEVAYREAQAQYARDIASLQWRCPHPTVSRGTAECPTVCDLCGKEI